MIGRLVAVDGGGGPGRAESDTALEMRGIDTITVVLVSISGSELCELVETPVRWVSGIH